MDQKEAEALNITILIILVCIVVYLLLAVVFYVFQESLIFQSKELSPEYAFKFEFPFEERNYAMSDGATLNALHLPAGASKGVILYFHGNAGNLSRWGRVVHSFTRYGYDVLVYDYRGYGKSSGQRSMQRMFDDAEEVYRNLLNDYDESQITIYGRSIGSAMATWLASRVNARRLMLETPFSKMHEALAMRLFLPMRFVLKYPFRNDHYMREVKMPIRIIHGTLDGVVPYLSGKRLYDRNKHDKNIKFTSVSGGGHNNLSRFDEFEQWLEESFSG